MSEQYLNGLEGCVRRALAEDLAGGDVTAEAVVPQGLRVTGRIVAKQELVVCGLAVVAEVFAQVGGDIDLESCARDGELVANGTVVARIQGQARAVLAGERSALNFLQRLSGSATLTRRFVDAAAGRCRIVDTRKTTPGLRRLQRYAVRCGGGHNHRDDLAAGVMIKENHIRAAGGIGAAIAAARSHASHTLAIECEVTTLHELREALEAGADIVMLDNMDDTQSAAALELVAGRALVEASGNISLARVDALASLGVDVISIGALTHSAPAADLSLLLELS